MQRPAIALIHGGLYEPMGAASFWVETGSVEALARRGLDVLAPERLADPVSWTQDADHVAEQLGADLDRPVPVVAGSNGCSTAARLAIAYPGLVECIAFCWPVTVGQDHALEQLLADRISQRSSDRVAEALLAGETLRGLSDPELASLDMPVSVMASEPENPVHRRATAMALLRLWADPVQLPAMPEPPTAGFDPRSFADAIVEWLASR